MPSRRTPAPRLRLTRLEGRETPAAAVALVGGDLVRFDDTNPAAATSAPVSGVEAGDTLVAVSIRPANGGVYGLAITADGWRLYAIDASTTARPLAASQTLQSDLGNTFPVPPRDGFRYALAFDPATDQARVTSDLFIGIVPLQPAIPVWVGEVTGDYDFGPPAGRLRESVSGALTFRMDPDSGGLIDGDFGQTYAVDGVNPDAPLAAAPDFPSTPAFEFGTEAPPTTAPAEVEVAVPDAGAVRAAADVATPVAEDAVTPPPVPAAPAPTSPVLVAGRFLAPDVDGGTVADLIAGAAAPAAESAPAPAAKDAAPASRPASVRPREVLTHDTTTSDRTWAEDVTGPFSYGVTAG